MFFKNQILKTIKFLFAASIIFVSNYCCGQLQNDSLDKRNIQMLKEFYTSYISSYDIKHSISELQKKLDSLQKKYCTEKLYKKLPEIIEETEADPFTRVQFITSDVLNNLVIKKDLNYVNRYIVSYSGSPVTTTPIIIHLTVVKGKIDSVW